jgi:hypothetical protein
VSAPQLPRDLVAESVVLIARAEQALATSRKLLGASSVLVASMPPHAPQKPRVRGFADLAAWNARER